MMASTRACPRWGRSRNEGGGVATHSATTGHIGVRPGHVRCKTCELQTGIGWEAHSSARCVRRRPLAVVATSSAAAGVFLVRVKVGLPSPVAALTYVWRDGKFY